MRRRFCILVALAAGLTACASQGVSLKPVDRDNPRMRNGAQLFAQRCAGCHTLDAAGAEGSSVSIADQERVDGPNFNTRDEEYQQVLYAIRNGGFSGALMPQNIVVGHDAEDVALFLDKYAGAKTPGSQIQPTGGTRPEVEGGTNEAQGGREGAPGPPP